MSKTLEEELRGCLEEIDYGSMDHWYMSKELAARVRRLINENIQQLEEDDVEGEVVFRNRVAPGQYLSFHDGFMWGAHWFAESLKK